LTADMSEQRYRASKVVSERDGSNKASVSAKSRAAMFTKIAENKRGTYAKTEQQQTRNLREKQRKHEEDLRTQEKNFLKSKQAWTQEQRDRDKQGKDEERQEEMFHSQLGKKRNK